MIDKVNREHHVILTKYGEDIYVDETIIESNYPDEEGRIENVVTISGNLKTRRPTMKLTLTQDEIFELKKLVDLLLYKESQRIGGTVYK